MTIQNPTVEDDPKYKELEEKYAWLGARYGEAELCIKQLDHDLAKFKDQADYWEKRSAIFERKFYELTEKLSKGDR